MHIMEYLFHGPAVVFRKLEHMFEDKSTKKATKIRPPRFVSFRMELEPYNEPKALALQKLNDINLKVFVHETVERVFTFHSNSLILTGRRLICVES